MGILLGAHFFMLKLEVLLCLLIILLHECIMHKKKSVVLSTTDF